MSPNQKTYRQNRRHPAERFAPDQPRPGCRRYAVYQHQKALRRLFRRVNRDNIGQSCMPTLGYGLKEILVAWVLVGVVLPR